MRLWLHKLRKVLGSVGVLAVIACPARAQQSGAPVPYASIGSTGVSYAGAGRGSSYDLAGPVIHIGVLAPLKGPRKVDGEAIVRAAQMALEDAAQRPLPGGIRLELAIGDESGPAWGRVSDAVLRLVFNDHAVAIVTSASGVTTHLSEQVGNKVGVPVLTLSTDATTTQINLPWIFRLGPSDTQQAQAIAHDIYRSRGYKHVLLVTESDHDGRMGGQEFVEAARGLGAPAPDSLAIDSLRPDAGLLLDHIKTNPPQAIVFWTQPEIAKQLLAAIRDNGIHAPIYFSLETAQEGCGLEPGHENTAGIKDPSGVGIYTVASTLEATPLRESFARRYQAATGLLPGPVAAEAYDAVRMIARAVRDAGPNRARVRDHLSNARDYAGVSGKISFDSQGNNQADVGLVRLQ
ncbi:MAG TPA: ABC transporter substrate-binding protein [Terriglobia bacterium]|nr:ABC transporter substrate-binding protein [Terriglobia bacterium]